MATTKLSGSLVLVNKQNGIVVIPEATPLTRLNYFDGKFLRASDLKAEQDYLRQLVRHSNQAGGPGVAHGFDLTLGSGDTVDIGPGLAIDPGGRVLLMPQGISLGVEELIEKSRDLQRVFGKANVVHAGGFEECELSSEAPPVNTTHPSNLYLIVLSLAEALCGEEDVFGKLCEEACATATDRPFVVEGVIVRAIPLVLQTPLPNSKAVSLTQAHLRSRVASAYFEDERRIVSSLISRFGLGLETWCLGADGAGGSGVPIGVIARAGATTVFLDPWIARRERIDTPARRYWQWRMMMRPWDVFLAQVLQFQCQLHDLSRKSSGPGGDDDPCGGARTALDEAATTIAELRQFYQSTTERFSKLNVNLEEAMTFKGGVTRLSALNEKLVSVGAGLANAPQDRWLIRGGIVELPSAGYLPAVPGAAASINQQVRRMMGEGVDLRFCVVRPDYVAHALEEAQHMERISLLQGLDDPKNKPAVDILVPNGEILEQKRLSPGQGFEARVNLNSLLLLASSTSTSVNTKSTSLTFRGAARTETLPGGGGAGYVSAEFEANQFNTIDNLESGGQGGATANPGATPGNTVAGGATFAAASRNSRRAGVWLSLSCERNVFELKNGDTSNFNARAILASSTSAKVPMLDVELNGVFGITKQAITKGNKQALKGHIDNAQLSFLGQMFSNPGPRKTILVDLDVVIEGAGSAVEIVLSQGQNQINLSANWGSDPLEIKAAIKTVGRASTTGQSQERELAEALLKQNADVLSDKNASHIQALDALELIASVLNDEAFADAKARLLFPPPPKPTDELLVRGTMDWVLFHRRRAKQCSEEKVAPPPPSSRQYQVFEIRAKAATEVDDLIKSILAGTLPANRLSPVAVVEFGGGVATLTSDTDDLLEDWKRVTPGNAIMFGGIANRDSASDDGETLSGNRLKRVESAVSSVSKLDPQARHELLAKVPDSTPVAGVDGAIILLTVQQVSRTCHLVFRVNQGQMGAVLDSVKAGDVGTAIGQFTQPLGQVIFNAGTSDVLDNSTQTLLQKWQQLGGGQIGQAATTIFPQDQTVPTAIALSQGLVIEKALSPTGGQVPAPLDSPSSKPFPTSVTCPAITFVAAVATRTALVIQAGLDGSEHFPATSAKRATVVFDDNVPRGEVLNNLIKSLTPNDRVTGVLVGAQDAGAKARTTAVVNAVLAVRPTIPVKGRNGVVSETDKQRISNLGINLAGIDEVIFLEPNPPTT